MHKCMKHAHKLKYLQIMLVLLHPHDKVDICEFIVSQRFYVCIMEHLAIH